MSSAAARAARRKAILSRGGDRLAKLTTSARGEDAPAYVHDDPPLAPLPAHTSVAKFVGEDTDMPAFSASASTTSARSQTSTSQNLSDDISDPSAWTLEQQQQFMTALLGGGPPASSLPGLPRPPTADTSVPQPGQDADPLAALMSSLAQFQGARQDQQNGFTPPAGMFTPPASMFSSAQTASPPPPPKTRLQRVMPLIHLLAAWFLLAYFVLWREPAVYETQTGLVQSQDWWSRWAELGRKNPVEGWGVQTVPFFWAFTTLAIVLHSWRIMSVLDPVQPPMLLSLALPYLPPPIPSLILNGLKYWQIAGIFLDDISALLVGVGLLIWIASWVAR